LPNCLDLPARIILIYMLVYIDKGNTYITT